jgi:hypothetical protein
MPKPSTRNNTTNYNASVVTLKQQAKEVYANALLNNQGRTEACVNRVALGQSPNTSYSGLTYVDQRVGANVTTCEQKALILASDKCLESKQ